jgi:citrate synthase
MDTTWSSAITDAQPDRVLVRGYPLEELIGRVSFADAVYLVLRGELPDARQRRLVDALLVCAVDHGPKPPTTRTARSVAASRPPLVSSVAAGILAISDFHGGAIERAMRTMLAVQQARASGIALGEAAQIEVRARRENRERIAGYGHRVHATDPRAQRLLALLREGDPPSPFVDVAEAIRVALEGELGRAMPINVDGAMAAVLCDLAFPPELANGFFALSRLPGLMAHVHEEMIRERPMRDIDFGAVVYDGPPKRSLPGE